MKHESITDLARESGGMLESWMTNPPKPAMWHFTPEDLERLVALVIAKERASILALIEELDEPPYRGYENPNTWDDALIALSALIRAQDDQESA